MVKDKLPRQKQVSLEYSSKELGVSKKQIVTKTAKGMYLEKIPFAKKFLRKGMSRWELRILPARSKKHPLIWLP